MATRPEPPNASRLESQDYSQNGLLYVPDGLRVIMVDNSYWDGPVWVNPTTVKAIEAE